MSLCWRGSGIHGQRRTSLLRKSGMTFVVTLGGIHRISYTVGLAVGMTCSGGESGGLGGEDDPVEEVKLRNLSAPGQHALGSGDREQSQIVGRQSSRGFVVTSVAHAMKLEEERGESLLVK